MMIFLLVFFFSHQVLIKRDLDWHQARSQPYSEELTDVSV